MGLVRGESPHEFAPMPVRRTENPGMWFGPRLGRSFKSDDDGKQLIIVKYIDTIDRIVYKYVFSYLET